MGRACGVLLLGRRGLLSGPDDGRLRLVHGAECRIQVAVPDNVTTDILGHPVLGERAC